MNNGMSALEAITTRISVRKFTDQPVTDEQVRILINAAFCAPSACNKRPWEFVVVRDRETLSTFAKKIRYQQMLADAPLAIVVCGSESRAVNNDMLMCDCSAAVQNILLAAQSMGLGACWCGTCALKTSVKLARCLLNLPEDVLSVATIAVGWPDESREQKDRYRPEHVHFDMFDNKRS